MTKLHESTWNPININSNNNNGYTISNYAVSTSWYNKVMDNSGTRRTRLKRYHDCDEQSVEIARALDILAEDVSSSNADNNEIFNLEYPDDTKTKKTSIKLMQSALDMWKKRSKMEDQLFYRVRKTMKYGITFYYKNPDSSLSELPTERFVGYVLSEEDEDIVTHYIYDDSLPRIDNAGRNFIQHKHMGSMGSQNSQESNLQFIPVDQLLIFKVGEGPFGESLLKSVYGVWKQMSMLEDAMVIYRVVRAPERRVYYIDVGNLQGPKRQKAIEDQRIRLMQKQANRKGQATAEYDPHSTSEDIFIPTNSSGKGSRVETLQGGENLGETRDLKWFANKMAFGFRIPNSMIDSQSEENEQHSDMRVGQLYQKEMRYMGHISRIKRLFEPVLYDNFIDFCHARELTVPDDMELKINESMSFGLYKDLEVNQTMLNVFSSTLSMTQLSKRYALQQYLNFDQEQIQANEEAKLLEKGVSYEKMKEMPQEVVANVVYGDGRLGKEYGIKPSDDGMGF